MGLIPGRKEVVEHVIPLSEIDEVTCREFFKGDIDPETHQCITRLELDTSNPDKATLLKVKLVRPGRVASAAGT